MPENKKRRPLKGFIPQSRESPEYRIDEPLYGELLDRWRDQGRTLPGAPDREWDEIVSRDIWPGDGHGRWAAGQAGDPTE
ncbi:hypothetical protein [Streptomyces sp. NPDC046821]|uniref:hypothetical protein n=1 Tax=Streptomyces sp. NPDC046821 TaxID=3154702 RepID=UPI0033DA64D7